MHNQRFIQSYDVRMFINVREKTVLAFLYIRVYIKGGVLYQKQVFYFEFETTINRSYSCKHGVAHLSSFGHYSSKTNECTFNLNVDITVLYCKILYIPGRISRLKKDPLNNVIEY